LTVGLADTADLSDQLAGGIQVLAKAADGLKLLGRRQPTSMQEQQETGMPYEEVIPGLFVHYGERTQEEIDELYRKMSGCVGFTSTRARTPTEPNPQEKSDE
jgi:hypothetical protein